MSISSIFRLIAKEFTTDIVSDDDLLNYILLAQLQLDQYLGSSVSNTIGTKNDLLTALLTAHIITIARRALGAAGTVQSVSEGALALSYTNTGKLDKDLFQTTSYGREFDRLSRSCLYSPPTRGYVYPLGASSGWYE